MRFEIQDVHLGGRVSRAGVVDLQGARQDESGAVLVRVELRQDEDHRRDRDNTQTAAPGTKYRSALVEPVAMTLRLDLHGLLWLAHKAARSKSGRSKSGPVLVTGGKRARFRRLDGWGDEAA